ncbi:hypothetical protein [Kordiimonas sp.]|uniref:hypothetical protein n=1 Tax=Kordiimonas sp. TaxID=1970157 RepID=UPI003A8FC0A1
MSGTSNNRRRIILHCGAPKTGTTSLQHFFYDHADALEHAGTYVPKRLFNKGDVDSLHRHMLAMLVDQNYKAPLAAARDRLRHLFHSPHIHTLLISNEDLLGSPVASNHDSFFPHAHKMIPRLGELLAGYEVEVRYFIRAYAGFLAACYVQDLRRGATSTLDSYLAGIDADTVNWMRCVGLLQETFGARNVAIFDHASLLASPQATVEMAFGDIIPALPPFSAKGYGKNRSVSLSTAHAMQRSNSFTASLPPAWRSIARSFLRRTYFALRAHRDQSRSRPKVVLPDTAAADFSRRYRQHYAALDVTLPKATTPAP